MISIGNVELSSICSLQAAPYLDFTFPMYRSLLGMADGRVVAIAASAWGGAPAGLALARIDSAEAATVLSVGVGFPWRRHGIGGALLAGMEEELRTRGCRTAECVYVAGNPSTSAVERLLQRRGWATPAPRTLICRAYRTVMNTAPWLTHPPPLDGATIFPWAELNQRERTALDPEIPPDFEPANSLGLHFEGEVAGWIITHRVARSLLRYTRLFVKPELRGSRRGVALVAASARRHPVESGEGDEMGIWNVSMDNQPMLNFVHRRMEPYLSRISRSMGSRRSL